MQREKWEDIKGKIKDNFSVKEEGSDHLEEYGGVDFEFIIFEGPLGLTKLEYSERPVVLDKKTNYSKRIGSETAVNYVYSETEKASKMSAFKWSEDDEEWMEMEAGIFS